MNRKTLMILTMVTLALTLPLASASDWTQFHCDVEHIGYSTSNAPDTNHTAWISDDIGAHSASSVTIADGQVFVYCWNYFVCLDEYTGAVLWNVSVNKTPDVCGSWVTPAYHDGRVFLSAKETCCLDAADGSLIWTFEPPIGKGAVDGGCTIADGMVITSDWDGRHYYCLNESDGTEIWNFTVADDDAQSTPAISDGRVVFGGWTWGLGGHIYCVNLTTGSEEWNITTPDHPCGSAAVSGGVVYMTTYNFGTTRTDKGELYALNLTDGSEIWSQPMERTDSTPAVAYGNVYVCGGCLGFSDLMTYCFNATTGDLIWNTSASDGIGNWKCSPAVADGKVFVGKPYFEYPVMDYVGTCALNASTGEIVWSHSKGGSSPAVADGKVFTIGSGKVYAFGSSIQDWVQFHYDTANTGNSPAGAPDTNHTKWITGDIGAVAGSQAMIMDDMVFVYANDEIYGISRETGATIWNTSIPGDTQGWGSWTSPAYNDGVLFASTGYNLTRIDAATGTVLQQIAFPDGGYSCNGGPTVADGRVFAGSGGSNYYAFDESDLSTVVWTYPVILGTAVSTPAVADEKVVFGEMSWGGSSNLFCVNKSENASAPGTTDTNWVTLLTGGIGGSASIDAANDRVYVATFTDWGGDGGLLYAVNFTTGTIVWSQPIKYSDSTPAISGEYIYVSGGVNAPGTTCCFNQAGVQQWTVPHGSWTVSPTIADDKLFTGDVAPYGGNGIYVFNATTGDSIWQHENAGSSPSVAEDADGNGIVVSIGTDGRVYAFGDTMTSDWTQFHYDIANTGKSPANAPDINQVKWISENISAVECSQAIIVGDQVFSYISAIGADDAIYALNRATGSVEWSATFPGETKGWGSSTTPAYADGVVFAAAGYNVTGFDAATGTKLQEIAFPDGGYLSNGGVTVADGMVFVGSGSGANYYALNASDLTDTVWNHTITRSRAYSTPAVADDRVVFGDAGWGFDDGYLYCVNEFTGDLIWSTNLTGMVWGSATIDAANNRVYVATNVDWAYDEGKLYALTFDTGVVQWSADIRYTSSTPAVSGEYIYVAASGVAPGVTYCFDSSGVEQWNVPTGSRKISPAVADGKLFTGNAGLSGMESAGTEGLYAYDAATGALIWQHEHAGSSPSVAEDADGNGIVVSIGTDGMVYAFGGEMIVGDADNNAAVTTADAALALRMAVGSVAPNDAADVNRDGAVTSLDALMILQAVAGAITI